MRSTLFLLGTILFIASCSKNYDDIDTSQTLIKDGSLSGSEEIAQQNTVFKKEKDWNAFLDELNTVNDETADFTETDIDFSEFMVIACVDKVQSSGGYDITITEITQTDSKVKITVENTQPADGAITTTVITQPYYIIKLPATDKAVSFK